MSGSLLERLAIQSWCFRGLKTHAEVATALRDCGVNNLEISGAHIDPVTSTDLKEVVEYYRSQGITITSGGLFAVTKDEARSRKAFEFARLAGLAAFTSDIEPGAEDVAERLCREYGIRLAIHNHGRLHRHGPVWALEELLAKTSENVGLCLDTAWMLDSGEDPIAVAKKFASRLYGVHVKDFVFDRAGRPSDVVVGQGNLDLPAFVRALRDMNFAGYFTLEYEGDVNDPVPSTRRCVEAVWAALAQLA